MLGWLLGARNDEDVQKNRNQDISRFRSSAECANIPDEQIEEMEEAGYELINIRGQGWCWIHESEIRRR